MLYLDIISEGFLGLFAAGRSSVKVWLFFLFLSISFLLFWLRKKVIRGNGVSNKKIWLGISVCSFVVLGILNVFVHGYILHKNSLGLNEQIIFMSNQEMSSSWLLHTHELKSVFGRYVHFFSDHVDFGVASADYVNNIFSVLCLIIFLCGIVSYCISLYKNETSNIKNMVFNSFIVYILFKNSLDGGIFNYEILAIALLLVWFCLNNKRLGGFMFVPVILMCTFSFVSFYVAHLLLTFMFLFLLYYSIFARNIIYRSLSLLLIVFLIFTKTIYWFQYINIQPEQGSEGHFTSFSKIENIEPDYVVGRLYNYTFKTQSVGSIIEAYNLVYNHEPVSIDWRSCIPHTYKKYKFSIMPKDINLIDAELSKNGGSMHLSFGNIYEMDFSKQDGIYSGWLILDSCRAISVDNQLQEGLNKLGLLPGIVYNFQLDRNPEF